MGNIVVSTDGTAIGLWRVESMQLMEDEPDAVVDSLKGDRRLVVTMVSGLKHTVLMSDQYTKLPKSFNLELDPSALRNQIFNKWVLLGGHE